MKKIDSSFPAVRKIMQICLITSLLLISELSFAQSPVNFSGKWIPNIEKSNPGEGGAVLGTEIVVITQDDNSITFDRTFPRKDGEDIKRTETYNIDGEET